MNLFQKIKSMLTSASTLENGLGDVVGHLAIGDKKGAMTAALTMLEKECDGHPTVKATLLEIQGDLATIGLADPVPAPAPVVQEAAAPATPQVVPQTAPQTAPITSPQ